ncbi:hypothetical protein TAMA11512_00350 [Selenomonas sp. TAMA-11512]|uniref:MBL fold metallo-hydrolase n=1 Tax=Selenomonas sp. TAMA-11512 TaxID=3095337 RepID=UPI003087626B|nr:hypothetical protein TAMA11512_00350 [Selenomonas sp. TAMA-11512]
MFCQKAVNIIERRSFIFGGLAAAGLLAGGALRFIHRPQFGRLPEGSRRERILASPNYYDGKFQCPDPIEDIMEESEDGESRLPAQHFSGRFLQQNQTQWASFALVTPTRKVFFSGDGGYGSHFKRIGEMFGGFDLAVMENGQYNKQWHRIHMLPGETAQASEDVGARAVLPAHSGKFALARHTWDAPYRDLSSLSRTCSSVIALLPSSLEKRSFPYRSICSFSPSCSPSS